MTSPGRYAAGDGSFAKSAGGAAARGGILIAVAVVLGLIILAFAYDDGDGDGSDVAAGDDAAADDATTPADDTASDDATTPADDTAADDAGTPADDTANGDTPADDTASTVPPTPSTRLPGEVKVVVANGVGEPGLAGTAKDQLLTFGYVVGAENAVNRATPTSVIYYIDGYGADAAAVAAALDAPASVVDAAPPDVLALVENSAEYTDYHIFTIQGQDRLLG